MPKYQEKGFTLVELITVISIVAIISAIALPNMAGMIKDYRLRSAGRQLFSTLQRLKMRAVKENIDTKIYFDQDGTSGQYFYQSFVDTDDDDAIDTDEAFDRVDLDENLTIAYTGSNPKGFTPRGRPYGTTGSTITISLNNTGKQVQIVMNSVGNIRAQ